MELSIALERPCYFPGEVLRCIIKVRRLADLPTLADADTEQLRLSFECCGSERVDPGWVGLLYRPDVTAVKDNRRLVRSIFSTGQVPLLDGDDNQTSGQGREFMVRCRLPQRLPPSYRGNAVRFVYQVQVQGRLVSASIPQQQQQQQQVISCQAQCSFVMWPLIDRSSGASSSSSLDRRATLQSPHSQPSTATAAAAAAGGSGAAATGVGSGGGPVGDLLADTEMIDYKLGTHVMKLRWEEVIYNADGTRTLLSHQPSTQQLYPALTNRGSLGSQALATQLSALDSLMLDDNQAAAAAGRGAEDGESDADQSNNPLRHLSPAQRASMAVRTFNLRAGEHPLLRLVLQPPQDGLLQPGGSFGLLLDFRAAHSAPPGSQPVCLQVVALLESEEIVLSPHSHSKSSDSTAMRKLYAEQQEVTAHLLTSHFVFSIPLTAPPSFRTPMVCHKWVLRFELLLGKPRPQKPSQTVTEQLLWSLPLVVFPPPTQAALGM